jgi:hypothetical protein
MTFKNGDVIIAVLQSPREKVLGILQSIDAAGITVRSVDLGYFDDWCRAIANGEPHLAMADNFYPMWRVERVSRDEGSADVPSMREQFEAKTSQELTEQ